MNQYAKTPERHLESSSCKAMTKQKILYLFIAHQKVRNIALSRITGMMQALKSEDYAIVFGGFKKEEWIQSLKVLELECNDGYEGLPEKVRSALRFIGSTHFFNEYTHIAKLDQDMKLIKLIDFRLKDYSGILNPSFNGNRHWHLGRCTPGSYFNDNLYAGDFVPWCHGGMGYIISRKAAVIVASTSSATNEIYEDLFVAKVLRHHKIYPSSCNRLKHYFVSPRHKQMKKVDYYYKKISSTLLKILRKARKLF